ncbi:MAG TPA: glycoside hydrolase family 5 protein [Clostridia bacterium]|nr:glycoside hydrolase family 5 protein [Clostridia bacterium]
MKNKRRFLLVIALTVLIASLFSACTSPMQNTAKDIAITPQSAGISTGETTNISLNGFDGEITWSSSDPYVVNVNNGVVTGGHKSGTATITAKIGEKPGEQTYTCTVKNTATMRDISPSQMVAEMKLGTNFARSLDQVGWDRNIGYDEYTEPRFSDYSKIRYYLMKYLYIPTPKTLSAFSKVGYNAVRLNVSFSLFTDDKTFVIDKEFLDLLEEIVNKFLDNGMYCIIDPHYDYLGRSWVGDRWEQNWMADEYKDYVDKRYAAIWSQVAERFKDYDDHLLFEAMNEPADGDKVYEEGGPYFGRYEEFERYNKKRVDEINELFVKTVRTTGGNNTRRVLSVSPMKQVTDYLGDFKTPSDDRLIVQVHYYFNKDDGSHPSSWKSNNPADTKQIDEAFDRIKKFKDRTGLPVILGEWGNAENLPLNDRIDQAKYIINKAKNLGLPAFWWESTKLLRNQTDYDRWSLYNRSANEWYWPELIDAISSVIYDKLNS